MYVCNCNGITETEVKEAVRSGARKWDDVHTYFDCAPCCGKCERDMADAIREADREPEPAAEPLFGAPGLAVAG
ncbi:MAG: bacterioferritin [Rhodospirillales bacterium CG15_BIG_FIL_POST_REV_8_21_14_020_66_15]|nr:MAG: bacterioferritin [Rhodospirillales bacterium CG15_BIG_FIL_POST_REV_8_21_14_020_66_15]